LPASRPKVLTRSLASAIDPLTDAAGAARSEQISMQDVKPSSLYRVESDHQRETAQISADPSSAFDGDGEPRFDAARFARPSGVETVRAELLAEQPLMRILADPRHSIEPATAAEGERLSLVEVNAALARAARLFYAHEFAVEGPTTPDFGKVCAVTVRRWVAVAREAARS
jgi:hypothetical protein